jgi:DNA-directed RNA polymerase specialized sigma24 family protein
MHPRNSSARADVSLTTTRQMAVYYDSTQTPTLTASLLRLTKVLAQGGRDYLLLSSLLTAGDVGDYGVRSYLENRFLNGREDDSPNSSDSNTAVRSTEIPLWFGFERTFTENPILPAQLGARVAASALPTVIDSLTRSEIHQSDRHWQPISNVPWWESQLPTVRGQLASFIRKRLPTRHDDHDDLINETFLSFCKQIQRHPVAFPEAWFRAKEPENDRDKLYLQQFLTIILRRRIADLFRKETRTWITSWDDSLDDPANDLELNSERQVLFAAMLATIVKTFADLSESEREVLALVSGSSGTFEKTLHARERQRLRRVRAKLAAKMKKRFGSKVSELLKEDT